MYCPRERVYAHVPEDNEDIATTTTTTTTRQRKPSQPAKAQKSLSNAGVVVHVVDHAGLCRELDVDLKTTILDACDLLATRTAMTAMTPAAAEVSSKALETARVIFGSGKILVYVLAGASVRAPKYLALGVTQGTGPVSQGTWTVITAFDGRRNPFTAEAIESSIESSCAPGEKRLGSLVRAPCFVRRYVTKAVLATLARKDDNTTATEKLTLQQRQIMLLRVLFTWSDETRRFFSPLLAGPA
jgi:hypothetical protein